jgi:hypothetical protein
LKVCWQPSIAGLRVLALDAAMPFDFEHRARQQLRSQSAQQGNPNPLKVGIVGFGTFGQFLARRFVQAGHQVRGRTWGRAGHLLGAGRAGHSLGARPTGHLLAAFQRAPEGKQGRGGEGMHRQFVAGREALPQ